MVITLLSHPLSTVHVDKNWNYLRVSCFGRAILLVFVRLAELAIPPALAADKHHLQIWRPKPSLCIGELLVKFKIMLKKIM